MSKELVRLPRGVAEAIESLRSPENGFSDYSIIGMMQEKSNHHPPEIDILNSHMGQDKMHPDDLIKAMVNGYEIEETPEDKVREYYEEQNSICTAAQDTSPAVIRKVLNILGIDIGGVNA